MISLPSMVQAFFFTCRDSLNFNSSLCLQEPADLFETISQSLLNAVDRDALSGWGAIVHVM